MDEFDSHIRKTLKERLLEIEKHLEADCVSLYGPVYPGLEKRFRDFLERLKADGTPRKRIAIILNTPGGSAETVERLVQMIRFHYEEVFFIVPDEAMSAGTIFCMAGDKIYMDYTSSLGPIDPQVHNGTDWVPALGYLDQVERMLQKAASGQLTDAEMVILQSLDLAMLSRYEQAKNLTITLLKNWLVEFKFKDWTRHRTDQTKKNAEVTLNEKKERAEEIARLLSDNKVWHSHGRMIGIDTLKKVLRLEIEDYSTEKDLRRKILAYSDFLTDYIVRNGHKIFLHHRCYF